MQGPPVYRIISLKSWAKEEILGRLGGCDFDNNPYIIDITPCEKKQEPVLDFLELYFSKKFTRELRLYPLYIISDFSVSTAHFYIVQTIADIAAAGVDAFVAGSAIFGSRDYQATINAFREKIDV